MSFRGTLQGCGYSIWATQEAKAALEARVTPASETTVLVHYAASIVSIHVMRLHVNRYDGCRQTSLECSYRRVVVPSVDTDFDRHVSTDTVTRASCVALERVGAMPLAVNGLAMIPTTYIQ